MEMSIMNDMTTEWMKERQVTEPVLQIRNNAGNGILHIQGYGIEDNRPYGFACKYSVPSEMSDWLLTQEDNLYPSLASGSALNIYIRGVVIVQYSDGYQINVSGVGGNFDESYVLDLATNKSHIMAMIDWASNNDLLDTQGRDDARPVIDMDGEEE